MMRTLSTLLFQSFVFGCLLVFLSLGSVEVLEDGRFVVTMCECDGLEFGYFNVSKGSAIQFTKLNPDTRFLESAICYGELIGTEWNKSPEIVSWIRTNAPHLLTLLPKKYHYFDHLSIKVALTPEHLKRLQDAKSNNVRIAVSFPIFDPAHLPQ